ncbi:hypothetical protein F3Y33_24740 (plasmid) [Rhizobium sp. BG6]|nr:hypothetical protein F3Y33_24740 [Rhizobium sp. BG6]
MNQTWNELLSQTNIRAFIADSMGGHEAGECASELAVVGVSADIDRFIFVAGGVGIWRSGGRALKTFSPQVQT